MSVVHMWVGAVSPSSARVVTKVSSASNVRLAVSTSSAMTSPTYFGPVTPSSQIASVTATGLAADADYWYQIEHGGVLDTSLTGRFTTHPTVGSQASYAIAVSSCAGLAPVFAGATSGVSNHKVFDTIRESRPLMFAHLGDAHYRNISTNSPSSFRTAYDDLLAESRQHQLYREVPLVYVWDDHDFGANNSDGTSASKPAAQSVYRERVPHYTLAEANAIYHSFQIGRVLWIVSDTRSDRTPNSATDDSSKTMLGATQKTWLDNLLATTTAEAIVWLMPTPWFGVGTDTWNGFTTERAELATMVADNGWTNRLVMVCGDRHALALADADGNTAGGWPILLAGSLDSTPEADNALYNLGMTGGRGRWGNVQVNDAGDAGIVITCTGMILDQPWRSHHGLYPTPAQTAPTFGARSHVLAL